jgi:glucose-1-phosphate cytidylyltransferase
MKVVILAGGLGTRLAEETEVKPKPMVEIGGKPILWHIMNIYAAQGCSEFVLALGYKGEVIKNYFINYYMWRNDISIHLANGQVEVRNGCPEDWFIHLVDTGIRTLTGGRIKRLAEWLGDETFMLTYGDGVANIKIEDLLKFHRKHGKLATVTAVRPPARFGGINLKDDQVDQFKEKPQIGEGWVNGGFFVLEPGVLDYIEGDDTDWEQQSLARLAQDGQLAAYRHEGFWQCMDTLRDVKTLENLWQDGSPPWKVW